MSTTFDGDFNALNSPDTAPRDEVILGRFEGLSMLAPVVWDYHWESWAEVRLGEGFEHLGGKEHRHFLPAYFKPQALAGWLPLPCITQSVGCVS